MKWGEKRACLHLATAALGIEKEEAVEKFDFACGADAAVKILEIRAAAESDMLAVVDMLAVGQHVRSGAAAKKGTLLKETYAPAGISQRDAGCQSRQTAA